MVVGMDLQPQNTPEIHLICNKVGGTKILMYLKGGGLNLGKDMYHDYCMPSSMVMFCDQLPSSPGDGGG